MNAASLSWSRLERILSSKSAGTLHAVGIGEGQRVEYFDKRYDPEADGAGGSGAEPTKAEPAVPFAELHACSAYNFLRGASEPEEIVEQAVELGISALGCVDRDGFYGAARFAAAAAERGVPTVFGAELSIDGAEAAALTVLCRGQEGYRRLSRLMTDAHMADRDKDVVVYPPVEEIARYAFDEHEQCYWLIVLGWEMRRRTKELVRTFGVDNCVVELVHTMQPVDVDHNDELHALAMDRHRLLHGPEEAGRPRVLITDTAHGPRIAAVGPAAATAGARVGMMLADARTLCPQLAAAPHDQAGDLAFLEQLAVWALRWGPWCTAGGPWPRMQWICGGSRRCCTATRPWRTPGWRRPC